jgi:replication factor A1
MRKISWKRGRPQNIHSANSRKGLESIARIAIRKNIDPDELFNALKEAWKQKQSKVQNLLIECRKKTGNSAIFLFTMDNKIIGQFPVLESLFVRKDIIKNYIDMLPSKALSKEITVKENLKIVDLEPRMKKVTITARVVETPEPRIVNTRWGTSARVSNALLADETGTIRLSLWNNKINNVSVDDVIKIENAKVTRFRGERQLRLGRNGELNVIEDGGFPSLDELKDQKV